ncbi:uncharacterized protein AC631_01423 [Debaryomyces fabryi]|uniref:Uncharacterized protein n=1 Tax=Debaryomyces fabryi TaxID=58627 RepID=A0A0V1Q3A8_9ASCO|nr:uncharacterized protein AC631_01423 [Debaryomyces fabryi]KSA02826.1 hypothetical protein AC631_01423 [Debaryomyces fabryi]CUM46119.1 unnamed protein product [Debaryomyces fabryi]
MPPKLLESTESTNNYPNIEKLKEKYSPQKRIPPPSRGPSESFSKNYKVFATAPKRNGTIRNPRNINGIEKQDLTINLLAPPILASRNSSPEIRSDDSLSSNGPKRLSTSGGLSPIRRSGSPVRRRHISEIELELNHESIKGNTETHERVGSLGEKARYQESQATKRQKVSFNNEVEYNDTFTTSSLNDDIDLHTATILDSKVRNYNNEKIKSTITEGPQEKANVRVNVLNMSRAARSDRFMEEVDLRLKSLEDTQKELLDILSKSTAESDTIQRINKLQESMIQLHNSIKRGT